MAQILDYLSTYYNRDQPAPPPSPDTLAASGADGLLQEKGCSGCHALDARVVGPSFREVAARYAKDSEAAGKLREKIRSGGQGAWGPVPMPPNAGLTDAELDRLARWVLQQK
jgi:cytochrome c